MWNKKTDRNTRLFEDWTRGYSSVELAEKYDVSPGRVSQIAKQVLRERREKRKNSVKVD